MNPKILAQIHYLAELLPPLALKSVTDILVTYNSDCHEDLITQILKQQPNPKFRRAVAELLSTWQKDLDNWDSRAIAAALLSSAHSLQINRQALEVELVWTGPESSKIRRTDQVLLQLIQEARQQLTIISFAVYKIPEITQALLDAIKRDVSLRIIVETPESIEGKIPLSIKTAFGKEIIDRAQIFIWSKEKRPTDNRGRFGALHIKAAIADQQYLFITSANLTEYALTLNMEMGLLVKSSNLATQVEKHINKLIEQTILTLIY